MSPFYLLIARMNWIGCIVYERMSQWHESLRVSEAIDEDAMKAFFDKFDTDANGTISFDEHLVGLRGLILLGISSLLCDFPSFRGEIKAKR